MRWSIHATSAVARITRRVGQWNQPGLRLLGTPLIFGWVVVPKFTKCHIPKFQACGSSPPCGCLRLVFLSYELFIWYTDSRKKIGFKHRELVFVGLHPTNSRPSWAYMDTKRRIGRLEFKNLYLPPLGHRRRSLLGVSRTWKPQLHSQR